MNKNISPKMDIKMVRAVQKLRTTKGYGYLKIAKILTKKYKKPIHQKSVFRWAHYTID
jgi:hypothetical protein